MAPLVDRKGDPFFHDDIAFCARHSECPDALECRRGLIPRDMKYATMIAPLVAGKKSCEYFWEAEGKLDAVDT